MIKKRNWFLLVCIFFYTSFPVFAATVTWTGLNNTSNWGDGTNWDNFTGPSPNDDVVIPDVTGGGYFQPILDGNTNLAGGTIEIDDSAGVNSTLDLAGFNLSATGGITIDAGATLLLQGDETISPITTNNGTVQYYGDGDGSADTRAPAVGYSYSNLVFTNSAGTAEIWQLAAALDVNGSLTVSGGATLDVQTYTITCAGDLDFTGGNFSAGTGTVEFDGGADHSVVSAGESFATVYLNKTGGTLTFSDAVDIGTSLTTASAGFNVAFFGPTGSVSGDTDFLNTGTVTFGDAGDSITFAGGLSTTAVTGGTNLFGTVSTTDTQMDLGAVTLDGNSTVVAGTGAINIASATDGAGSFSLDLQDGAATGTVTFAGNVTINDLNTFSSAYSVVFQGASNTIDTDTIFLNTAGLTLGNGGDSLTFDGGLDTTAVTGGTTVNGDIITSNDQIDFGAVTLGGASVIDSAGAIINIASVAGAGNTLGLDAGAAGAITVSGAVDNVTLLTVTDSASMTFAGTVGSGTPGAVTLTDTAGTIAFQDNTDITTLTTTGQGYNLSFTGTATSVSNTAVFNNTGTLTLGNAGDTLTFPGGLDSSGGPVGTISVGGTINANGGNDIVLQSDDTITATAAMSVNGAGTVSLSAAAGISLTAAESDISTVGGTITINADNDANNTGDWVQSDAGSAVTSSGGAVSITAADIALTGTISSGAGDITLRPSTDARTIALNDAAGNFSLDAAELTQLDSSGTVTVGRTTGTGTISIGSAGTLNLGLETYGLTLEGATSVTDFNFTGANTLTLAAGKTLNIAAGGNVTASGVTDVTISGGTLQLSSAGSVTLVTQVADLGAGTTTGAVDLTNTDLSLDVTGAFSAGNNNITVNTGTGTFSNSAGTFSAGTQSVSITADDVDLSQTLTGTAGVAIQASTAARAINIGTDLNLGLTDSDLDNISTNILTIGDAGAGAVTVSAAVSPASAATLHLVSGGGYTDGAGDTITVTNLAISAGGAVVLDAGHSVTTVAVSAPGQAITFTEADGFTIGTVDGVTGFNGSTVTITGSGGNVTVNNTAAANDINGTGAVSFILQGANRRLTVDAGADIETSAGGLIIEADRMALNGSVTGTGQPVVLQPHTAGRLLDLGGADVTATTLGLTDAELDNVTAGVLTIGNAAMGAIDVSAAVSPAGTNTLHLISDEGFTDDAGITVANLAVDGDAAAVLDAGHDVDTLAFILTDNGADFTFVDTDDLSVGTVDLIAGGATNNGAISISTQDGNLAINQAINAGTQTVQLEAGESVEGTTANLVLDANITGSSVALIAGDALNQTGGAISASSLGIEAETVTALTPPANLSTLAFNITGAGNFTFTDPDDFAVGTVGTVVGGTTADGNISLTATNGTITVSDNITAGGTGTVLLDANGGTSDISVGAIITSSSGIITLNADNDVDFGAAGSISSTSGNVSVTADADAVATGTSGAVDMDAASFVDAGSGTISFSADGGITLSLLQTTDNNVSAVSVISGNGAIEEDGDAGIDIIANSVGAEVTLRADNGIGDGGTIEIQAAAIDAVNAINGAIQLDETDGLIILQARNTGAGAITVSTAGITTVQAAGGGVVTNGPDAVSIDVGADASLTVNDVVTSGGNTISLSADDDIIFGADGDVDSNGGVVTVTADNDNDNNGSGGALSMNDNTLIDAGNAAITLGADEDITLGSVVTTGVVVVGLTSKNGAVVDGGDSLVDVDAAAATLSIDAETGIGDGGAIDTMVDVLDAVNATSGALQVTETAAGGALQVYQAAQSSGGNAVNVQTVNGDLTVTAGQSGISVSGAATVTLTAGDNDASNDDDLIINDTVTAGSLQITLTSQSNDVRFGADGDVSTAGGEIEVNAGAAGAGLVTLANGTVLNAGAGLIDINGIGNVTLGRLVTSNNTASAVDVLSSAGQIIDGGNLGGADIAATWANAVVNLNAAGAIGVGDAIDTDIVTLTGSTTAAGNVEISETSDITIQSFTVSNGSFTLSAGGAVTATSVVLSSDAELNDISIASGGGGNITAGILTAGTGTLSDVSLNSAGILTDAAGKITAQVLTADAAGAMTLDTTAVSIDAGASAVGNIIITETDAVTLTDIDTSNGDITVTAATGNISVGAVDDLDGGNTVTITADDGAINGVSHDATADISAATITLKADSGGIGTGTILDVNATVQLNADTTVDNGSILIEDVTGNLPIGTMTTGGAPGDITLWADNADQDVTDATSTVTCGVLTIRAGGDIGALTTFFPEAGFTPINTTASNLDLRSGIIAGAGSVIAVSDTASPGLTRVDASPAAAGTALIKAAVNLTGTVTAGLEAADDIGLVSTGGAGTVTVPAGMDADDLRLEGNDLADSDGGDIDLDALNYLLKSGGAESFTITTAGGWIDAETNGALSVTNDGGALVVDDYDSDTYGALTNNGGNLDITSNGDITIDLISSGAGNNTSITSSAGSVNEIGTGDATVDIIASVLTISAQDEIGSTANDLDIETTADNLDLDTANAGGNIVIDETDAVIIDDITAVDGDVTLTAGNAVTAPGAGNDVTGNTISITTTTAAAGTGGIGASGVNNELMVNASTAFNADSSNSDSDMFIDSAGDLPIGLVDAGAGDVELAALGNITDAAADGAVDVFAGILQFDSSSISLDTSVTTARGAVTNGVTLDEVSAIQLGDGTDNISAGGAVSIEADGSVTTGGTVSSGADQNLTITTTGNGDTVTLSNNVSAGGSGIIDINSGDSFSLGNGISLGSGTGNITVDTANNGTLTVNGNITTAGAGTINLTSADAVSMDTDSLIQTADGQIGVSSAANGLTVDVIESTGSAAVNLTATGSAIEEANDSARVGALGSTTVLTLTAGTDIGALSALNTNVGTLRLTAGGVVGINESTALVLGNAGQGVTSSGGNMTIAAAGNITTGNTVTTTAGDYDITITSSGGGLITLGNTVTANGAGNIDINSAAAFTLSDTIVMSSTSGNIEVDTTGANALIINGNITTGTGGTIDITGTNAVAMDTDSLVQTANGQIDVSSAAGGLTVDVIESTGSAAINLTATGNAIEEADDSARVGAATSTTVLTLSAGTGIGAVNALNTNVGSITASTSASGEIDINETTAVTLTSVTTNNGPITVAAAGTITATLVDSSNTDNNSNGISLSTTAGNILAGTIDTGGTAGDVILTANTLAGQSVLDNTSSIIADDLSIITRGAIGAITTFPTGPLWAAAGTPINIDVEELLSITTGDNGSEIYLSEADDAAVNVAGAVVVAGANTGDAIIEAGGSLTIGPGVAGITLTSGDNLSLDAAATLTIQNGGLNAGAGDLVLSGIADIQDSDHEMTLACDELYFNSGAAGGNTTLNTNITALTAHLLSSPPTADLTVTENDAITLTDVDTDDGNISVTASGSIAVVDVDDLAGTNLVTLDSTTGAITDGGGAAPLISAGSLKLLSRTGIGDGNALETDAAQLAAEIENDGDLSILNSRAVDITTVDTLNGIIHQDSNGDDSGGTILVRCTDAITVSQPVINNDNGSIFLAAEGNALTDDVTINANITSDGAAGEIQVFAGDTIAQTAGTVSTTGLGGVSIAAGTDFNGTLIQAGNAAGAITQTDGLSIQSVSGDITLIAAENVSISILDTAGDVSITANDTTYLPDNNSGAIIDNLAAETPNITADDCTLSAATGIGSVDNIDTTIATLDADNTGTNNIDINETNALAIQNINQGGVGTVNVDAGGTITVTAAASGVTSNGGQIELDANGAGSDIAVNDAVTSGGGAVNILADDDVSFGADGDVSSGNGTVTVDAGTGAVTMTDGALIDAGNGLIDIDAAGNIALGGLTTTSVDPNSINLNSGAAVTDNGNAHTDAVSGGRLVIDAVSGVGSGDAIETTVASIDIDNTGIKQHRHK